MPGRTHPLTGCRYDTVLDHWMIQPEKLEDYRNLGWGMIEKGELAGFSARSTEMDEQRKVEPYRVVDGVARMSISGPMTKVSTSMTSLFGGTGTIDVRNAIKAAVADPAVRAIMLDIDSPGGTVSGTQELAHAVRKANKVKPVVIHAEDQMTSAAQWVGAMGRRVTCGPTARCGSVGVIIQLVDPSKNSDYGKPVIVSTGKYKDTYAPPYTPEKIAEIKREHNKILDVFWGEVSATRPSVTNFREEILTARVFIGQDASRVGLVDAVCSADEAFERAKKFADNPSSTSPNRSRSMLTAQDHETLRKMAAGASVTEDNADQVALQTAVKLNANLESEKNAHATARARVTELETALNTAKGNAAPAPMDATLLRDRCENAVERLHIRLEKGQITSAQFSTVAAALLLAGTVDKDGKLSADAKPDEAMFSKDGSGKYRYEKVFAAFDENKPNGLTQDVSRDQPAPRTEPGAVSNGKEAVPTLARVNELRAKYGEQPCTQEEYNRTYAAELAANA